MKKLLLAAAIIGTLFSCSKPENNPTPIQQTLVNPPLPLDTISSGGVIMKKISHYSWTKRIDGMDGINGSITSTSITTDNYSYYYEINNGDTTLIDEGINGQYETRQFDGDTLRRVWYTDGNPPYNEAWFISFKNESIMEINGITYDIFENGQIFETTYTQIYGDSNQFIMGWTETYSKEYQP